MIGLFDSGVGGLTVLRTIRARAPQADIIYFGDIANAPYGTKNHEELAALTKLGIETLLMHGAHDVVSACNSASTSFLEGVVPGRFIEMTRPTARAMRLLAGSRVLLLATEATVRSRIYNDALDPIVTVTSLPMSGLASMIENGLSESEVRSLLQQSFESVHEHSFDAVLLACTHYPLVRGIIQEEAEKIWGHVLVLDPADAVAEEVINRFDIAGDGRTTFYISKESAPFRSLVTRFFGANKYAIEIV
jgi:glutamate racemase